MAKIDGTLTAERLRSLLSYDADTGEFTWHRRPGSSRAISVWNARYAGKKVGCLRPDKHPYRVVSINDQRYRAHRLAWLYMTGRWPVELLDHIDCDPTNNRWANLREASHGENGGNKRMRSDNSTGFKGVNFHKAARRFVAEICVNKKKIYLGLYDSAEDAHTAYMNEARKHYGAFARAR